VPRPTQGTAQAGKSYAYRAVTLYGPAFQAGSASICLLPMAALQPPASRNRQGLGSSRSARHYSGNHYCFLFLRVLRCFSSPGSPPDHSGSPIARGGCPIRAPADQRLFAPPRGLSQLIAPFFASESQGIPRAPLFASYVHLYGASPLAPALMISLIIFDSCAPAPSGPAHTFPACQRT
jgi:hypothetical protein